MATSRQLLPQGSRPQTKTKERFLSRTSAAVSHYRSILPSRLSRHRILCGVWSPHCGRPYLPLSIYGNTLMAFPCKWRCEWLLNRQLRNCWMVWLFCPTPANLSSLTWDWGLILDLMVSLGPGHLRCGQRLISQMIDG